MKEPDMKNATIVVATDFSAAAAQALERAAMIAAHGGARLELVNVASARSLKTLKHLLSSEAGSVEARLIEEATVELKRLARDLTGRFAIEAGSFVAVGSPAKAIVAYADEVNAALLVVGGRGSNPARDLLLGTTAQSVIRRSRRPVLVVKRPAGSHYGRILAATDFSGQSAAALCTARAIAPDAALSVLHAYEVPFESKLAYAGVDEETIARYRQEARREAESGARQFSRDAGIDPQCTLGHGYPPRVIRDHAQHLRPDLIAVGKHGQTILEELLIGSVSEHVLANAECDVLVAGQAAGASAR
jgi:nucleotide-binding universal stress UspA family protein